MTTATILSEKILPVNKLEAWEGQVPWGISAYLPPPTRCDLGGSFPEVVVCKQVATMRLPEYPDCRIRRAALGIPGPVRLSYPPAPVRRRVSGASVTQISGSEGGQAWSE